MSQVYYTPYSSNAQQHKSEETRLRVLLSTSRCDVKNDGQEGDKDTIKAETAMCTHVDRFLTRGVFNTPTNRINFL